MYPVFSFIIVIYLYFRLKTFFMHVKSNVSMVFLLFSQFFYLAHVHSIVYCIVLICVFFILF